LVRNLIVIFIHRIFGRVDTADRHKIRTVIKKKHTYTTRLIILFNIMSLAYQKNKIVI